MELSGLINQHKNKFINSAILIIAVVIAFNIHVGENKKIAVLEEQKNQELRKNEILNEIAALEKKVSTYRKQVNNKEISGVINKIGNIAKDSRVDLLSINPKQKIDYELYTKYDFGIDVSASSYHNIGKFISSLENDPDIYFVDNIAISLEQAEQEDKDKNMQKLKADLQVSTILVKN